MSDNQTSENEKVYRRSLLKSGAVAGIASTGLAAVSTSATATENDDTASTSNRRKTKELDIPSTSDIYRLDDGELVIRDKFKKKASAEEIELFDRQAKTLNKMQANGDLIIEKKGKDIVTHRGMTLQSGCGETDYDYGLTMGWSCTGLELTVKADHDAVQDALDYDNTFIALMGIVGMAGGLKGAAASGAAAAFTVDTLEANDEGCGIKITLCAGGVTSIPDDLSDLVFRNGDIEPQECCL